MSRQCPAPLCAEVEIRFVDRRNGQIVNTLDTDSAWTAQWQKTENSPARITINLPTNSRCCRTVLEAWRHRIDVIRAGTRVMSYLFTRRLTADAETIQIIGVTPMFLALLRWFNRDITFDGEATKAFAVLLDEAEQKDPLNLARQPIPLGVDFPFSALNGDPLATIWNQQAGILEWTEYADDQYPHIIRFGETAYQTGLTATAQWWTNPILNPSTDGEALASAWQVRSPRDTDEGGDIVAWWPPETNGQPPRGSLDVYIPKTATIPDLANEAEAEAIARRLWEKSQNPDLIDDLSNTLGRNALGFCPASVHPGAVITANIETACDTIQGDMRVSELVVDVDSGQETFVSPNLVTGQS